MNKIIFFFIISFSFSSYAQTISCFESSIFNEEYETKICLNDLGKKQEIIASGFFSGFSDLPGFEDDNIQLKELQRGLTIKGDPQIIYAPAILNDGREIYISLICAEDYGIQFNAALKDGDSFAKNILIVGKNFRGCKDLWALFP